MELSSISEAIEKLGSIDYSAFLNPEPIIPQIEWPEIETIDPEDTIMGDIKRQIIEQNRLFKQQIKILSEQNNLLTANYDKLKEMFDAQVESNAGTKEDLERSRKYNRWMMIIAIVAMFAAIAGPIVTILVSV